jgi:hypothetical protein
MTFTPGWERGIIVAIVLLEALLGLAYLLRGHPRLGLMWIFYAFAAGLIAPWQGGQR